MPYTSDSHEYEELLNKYPKAIKVLAEGDSWLAYPRRFFALGPAANIVQVLGKKKKYVIYTKADNGDEALAMMSGEQKLSFSQRMKYNWFDVIIFSGGGNDIVGRYDFDFFIGDRSDHPNHLDCIRIKRLEDKLLQIKLAYREMLERVREYSVNPDIVVVSHVYDFITPSRKGFAVFDLIPLGDSWLYPFLKRKGYENSEEQAEMINFMLRRFREVLLQLQVEYEGLFYVAETQGLLNKNQWRNEIHPTPEGFKVITKAIEGKVKDALNR
ncbi:MAG: hypothetical protein ACPGMR_02035 [Pontibacterium sp.]